MRGCRRILFGWCQPLPTYAHHLHVSILKPGIRLWGAYWIRSNQDTSLQRNPHMICIALGYHHGLQSPVQLRVRQQHYCAGSCWRFSCLANGQRSGRTTSQRKWRAPQHHWMSEAMTRVGSGHWNDPTTDVLRRSYGNISSNDIISCVAVCLIRHELGLNFLSNTHIKHQKAYISALHQRMCVWWSTDWKFNST